MPFGDHPWMRLVSIERADWVGRVTQAPPTTTVDVPEAPRPAWWHEYLVDEWRRRQEARQKPRPDRRTGWQRAHDEWLWQERRRDTLNPSACIAVAPALHHLWGDPIGEQTDEGPRGHEGHLAPWPLAAS